jgi:hypothetical protein
MLNNSYIWGTAGNAATYDKQYDTESTTLFRVGGLPANQEQAFVVSREVSNSGKSTGYKIEFTFKVPVPGSTTGETRVERDMAVIKRSEFDTLASYLARIERLKMLLADTALMTKIFNGER